MGDAFWARVQLATRPYFGNLKPDQFQDFTPSGKHSLLCGILEKKAVCFGSTTLFDRCLYPFT